MLVLNLKIEKIHLQTNALMMYMFTNTEQRFCSTTFVFFQVMETFSKDFLEVHGLRSQGFQLLLHELQQRCARDSGNKFDYICWIKQQTVEG